MVLKMTCLIPWDSIYSVQLYLLQCDGVKDDLSDAMEWYPFRNDSSSGLIHINHTGQKKQNKHLKDIICKAWLESLNWPKLRDRIGEQIFRGVVGNQGGWRGKIQDMVWAKNKFRYKQNHCFRNLNLVCSFNIF